MMPPTFVRSNIAIDCMIECRKKSAAAKNKTRPFHLFRKLKNEYKIEIRNKLRKKQIYTKNAMALKGHYHEHQMKSQKPKDTFISMET